MARIFLSLCLVFWLSGILTGAMVWAQEAEAGTPVELDHRSSIDAAPAIRWYYDERAVLKPDDLPSLEHVFKPLAAEVLNQGYIDGAVWLTFKVHNPGPEPLERWLEVTNPLLDEVRLYERQSSPVWRERISDYRAPFDTRELRAPAHLFRIELDGGESRQLWLRIVNTNATWTGVRLWTEAGFTAHMVEQQIWQGMIQGAMLIMLCYNLFIFWTVREKSYIWYCLYLAGMAVFMATEQVQGLAIFDQIPTLFDKQYLPWQMWIEWLFIIAFSRSFLETRAREKDIDVVVRLFRNVALVSLLITPLMPLTHAVQWGTYATLAGSLIMIGAGLLAYRRGNPSAQYYALAWTASFGAAGLFSATVLGLVPFMALTPKYPPVGVLIQVVLIAFALANHIKTVQRQALCDREAALQHMQRYQEVFNNAVEGIFRIGLDGRFIEANPALARMLGYPRSGTLKRHCRDALAVCVADPSQRQRLRETLEQKGGFQGEEVEFVRQNGQQGYATLSMHVVRDRKGRPSHIEGVLVDMTERREREQLEHEREQARMLQKIAQASAEAKSQFLAHMSHEIRTPLTAIIGYGETLLDEDVSPEEYKHAAETVVRSGRHLLDLINDILDHSKIEANRLTVEKVPVHLFALLDDVRNVFEERAREKGLHFSLQYDFPLPEVIESDPVRLRQILINLLGNAFKFTEAGSITLSVACDRASGLLHLHVRDTGIGMTPDQLARVFQPFAQADDSVSRRYGGTGLGLVISRKLAHLLGGDITVHSRYGEGTEFQVTVGIGRAEPGRWIRGQEDIPDVASVQVDLSAPKLAGRVLVAEDNPDNQQLLRMMLSKTGVGLSVVDNGRKALEAALAFPFDLILMDVQMPEMGGLEAVRNLREAGYRGKIVALTANVLSTDIEHYRQAGFDEWLAKPIDRARLYAVMESVLPPRRDIQERPAVRGTILLAEDNPVNQKLIRRLLEKAGAEVDVKPDGKQALEAIRSDPERYQLVLTDVEMPHMDGLEATRKMREAGYTGPIYALTGNTSSVDVKCCFAAGCDGHLAKPVDRKALYELLENCLGGQPAGQPPATERES
ncbi:MAG: response regulator [Gammaproteobacteria bacterium]|nr:MAG: response regulator [Gammaproteobacteria bacterium]